MALHFLWQGLADYVLKRDIEVLFGVASFHGTDPAGIAQALSWLHHNHLAPSDIRVSAKGNARLDMNLMPPEAIDRREALGQIPALIKSYLRLGGFVGQDAWIDRHFNTIDVCLLMDTGRMTEKARAQYTTGQVLAR